MTRKKKRNLIPYTDMSENDKDKLLEYIRKTGMAVSKAAIDFNISITTLNKIFDERYNKREKKIEEMKKNINLDE